MESGKAANLPAVSSRFRKKFERLGIFGDWEHPYLTLTPDYEMAMCARSAKPCSRRIHLPQSKTRALVRRCETALAEAEVEYEENSSAVFVKFKAKRSLRFEFTEFIYRDWTTTPRHCLPTSA